MGIRERREREKEEIRAKILDAAEQLFFADGYRNVTIRKIAGIIEYSPPVIYEYFKDKADILLHIIRKGNGLLLQRLEEVYHRDLPPLERLRGMGRAYVRFALENSAYYELAFISNVLRDETGLPYIDGSSPGFRAFDLLVAAVRDCGREGGLPPGAEMIASETLWAGIHGLVSLLIAHPEFPWGDKDALIEAMLDTLLRTLTE